jgi:hypothetical protein
MSRSGFRLLQLVILLLIVFLWKRKGDPSKPLAPVRTEENQENSKDNSVESDDMYNNRWLHDVLKSKPAAPPAEFACNGRPRDWKREPFLIYAEDKLYKENYTESDLFSLKRCKQPWAYTRDIHKADAVVIEMYEYGNLLPTNPKRYCPGQLLVLKSMESVWNYPALDIAKTELGYDLVSDYRLDSDVPLSYVSVGAWLSSAPPTKKQFISSNTSPFPLAAAFISNCKPHLERNKIIRKLSALLGKDRIHQFGKCYTNQRIPAPIAALPKAEQKKRVLARYKFAMVFENSVETDYVTEKIYDAFAANTLPVYFGDKDIRERGLIPNRTSIIHVNDYTVEDLAKLLESLDKDWIAYQRYFAWKRWPKDPNWEKNLSLKESRIHDTCHLATIGAERPR